MKRLYKFILLMFLLSGVSQIFNLGAEDEGLEYPKQSRVYSTEFEGYSREPFLGTPSAPGPPAFFRQGFRLESGVGGPLVVREDGTMIVTARTFIYCVSKEGKVELLAGVPGFSGQKDGPADLAQFSSISVMREHPNGDLYLMEAGVSKLRVLSKNKLGLWEVRTLRLKNTDGGEAELDSAFGMTIFDDGRVFIMDGNYLKVIDGLTLRTLNPEGGKGFNSPPWDREVPLKEAEFRIAFTNNCLTSDGKNFIFIADMWNNVLRRVDLKNKSVTIAAGGPPKGNLGYGMPKGGDRYRDGPAMWARIHPGGGISTAYMNRYTGNIYMKVADGRPHVLEKKDNWLRTLAVGLPVAFGKDGVAYTRPNASIHRLRKLKEGEVAYVPESPPKDERLFFPPPFEPASIASDIKEFPISALEGELPTIDGLIDEACWSASRVYLLKDSEGKIPPEGEQTEVRILTDSNFLYFSIHCEETNMAELKVSNRVHDDRYFYADDYFELFLIAGLDPSLPAHQIMVNNNGQCWDGKNKSSGAWNPSTEIKVHRDKNFWSIELKIPLKEVGDISLQKKWRMNLGRFRTKGKPKETSWSRLYSKSSHDYRRFNIISFEASEKD